MNALVLLALLLPAAANEPTARELLDQVDDLHRGTSSHALSTMHVKTSRWDRTLSMEVWSEGDERSLIRILSPAKEAGMTTLKVDDNIWNYLPKVDRTMKVPAGMMSNNWMGSHFTNDDLVKESRMADDYIFQFTSMPDEDPTGLYVIECIPNPDAPVVWGKVVVQVRAEDRLPTEITYWDERGTLVRTMAFDDIREIDGRPVPFRMMLTPADTPEEFTEVIYDDLNFDVEIPASVFTLQALKR
jgi:outer membrane lipoprotein-sorting protein